MGFWSRLFKAQTPNTPTTAIKAANVRPYFKAMGSAIFDEASSVALCGDKVYVAGTASFAFAPGKRNAFIACLDLEGNIKWFKTIGGPKNEIASSVAVYGDKVYVAGWTESFGNILRDSFIACLDLEGNIKWFKTIGGPALEFAPSVAVYGDKVYVAGTRGSLLTGELDAFIACLDPKGKLKWLKAMGRLVLSSLAVYGERVYVAGSTAPLEPGGRLWAFIACLDLEGNIKWFKTIGGPALEFAQFVAVYGDKVYVAGSTESFGAGELDAFIACLDLEGNIKWFKTIGGPKNDSARFVAVYGDKVYVAGSTESFGASAFIACLPEGLSEGLLKWEGGVDWSDVVIKSLRPQLFDITPEVEEYTPLVPKHKPKVKDHRPTLWQRKPLFTFLAKPSLDFLKVEGDGVVDGPLTIAGRSSTLGPVRVYYRVDEGPWQLLATVEAGGDGDFAYTWIPKQPGVYEFKTDVDEGLSASIAVKAPSTKP